MISEPSKLFQKHTSSSTGELGEQKALPLYQCSGFPLQPWTVLAKLVNRGFVDSPHPLFFFSTLPDTKLACFLLLALEQLHPADTLRVLYCITV